MRDKAAHGYQYHDQGDLHFHAVHKEVVEEHVEGQSHDHAETAEGDGARERVGVAPVGAHADDAGADDQHDPGYQPEYPRFSGDIDVEIVGMAQIFMPHVAWRLDFEMDVLGGIIADAHAQD